MNVILQNGSATGGNNVMITLTKALLQVKDVICILNLTAQVSTEDDITSAREPETVSLKNPRPDLVTKERQPPPILRAEAACCGTWNRDGDVGMGCVSRRKR